MLGFVGETLLLLLVASVVHVCFLIMYALLLYARGWRLDVLTRWRLPFLMGEGMRLSISESTAERKVRRCIVVAPLLSRIRMKHQ